jgi:CBS domain-containing membrane protein
MQDRLLEWCRSFAPAPLTARPKEWLRAAIGVGLALFVTLSGSAWLFGLPITLLLAAPAAASAVLIFAASSSPFAQPWSVVGGSLLATFIGISLGLSDFPVVIATVLTGCLVLVCLFGLRCLHPPGGALALIAVAGTQQTHALGYGLLYPVAFNALLLVIVALVYNNLTGHAYPKAHRRAPAAAPGEADLPPSQRLSFTEDDVEQALEEFGEYVDVTRDDLAQLIRQTERHALRRSMGEVTAADVMSRDLHCALPGSSVEEAWQSLRSHGLRALPVVEPDSRRLLGVVTLEDLLRHFRPGGARVGFGRLKQLRGTRLRSIMRGAPISVTPDAHMLDLVFLLSEHRLYCLPVVDEQQRLVGLVTQTDLIAALYQNWLRHLAD